MVNKKIEKFSVDNLDDSRIKIVFGTVYILGSLVIFFSSKFLTPFIAMLILILLMGSYIVGIFFFAKENICFIFFL